MFFVISLLPATLFAVLGYIVLYCANRSEGGTSTFGKILAIWVFVLALFFPLSGAYFAVIGFPFQSYFEEMHGQQ